MTDATRFLTATGHKCDDVRQEFVLLSDVLGVSMLVETVNHRTKGVATESTVLGPFHVVESPPRPLAADISLDGRGEACLVTGRVTGPDGAPIPDDGPVGARSTPPAGIRTGRPTSTSSCARPATRP